RQKLWPLIEQTPNLIWQLLTKRPQNIMRMVPKHWSSGFPDNVWVMTTAENQQWFDIRAKHLRAVPAKILGFSCEPLLGPIDIGAALDGLDPARIWIIAGGESSNCAVKCRPSRYVWFASLRDQCQQRGIPFFFKQWGNRHEDGKYTNDKSYRLLDGREWNEFPKSSKSAALIASEQLDLSVPLSNGATPVATPENQALVPSASTPSIDHEFESLVPPLSEHEYKQLRENILTQGCLDPIKLWNGTVVDGHNRLKICTECNVPYQTEHLTFESRDAAKKWVITQQLGRRNLNLYQRARLALALKAAIEARAKSNQRGGQGGTLLPQNSAEAIETRAELAKLAGVSHDTV
ncbi:MAG: DUF5131 family protein, partial [Acidobacteriota bacterium]